MEAGQNLTFPGKAGSISWLSVENPKLSCKRNTSREAKGLKEAAGWKLNALILTGLSSTRKMTPLGARR